MIYRSCKLQIIYIHDVSEKTKHVFKILHWPRIEKSDNTKGKNNDKRELKTNENIKNKEFIRSSQYNNI